MFAQLGYPNDAATIERRLLSSKPESCVFVAELDDRVAGCIAVTSDVRFIEGEMAEIAALVVDETRRGHRIGAQLVRAAEAWAAERGLTRIRVRSNVIRKDAHRFYEREKYAPVKDQRVFEKRT